MANTHPNAKADCPTCKGLGFDYLSQPCSCTEQDAPKSKVDEPPIICHAVVREDIDTQQRNLDNLKDAPEINHGWGRHPFKKGDRVFVVADWRCKYDDQFHSIPGTEYRWYFVYHATASRTMISMNEAGAKRYLRALRDGVGKLIPLDAVALAYVEEQRDYINYQLSR